MGRVAATDVDGFVEGGVFFPDSSCPLKTTRNFGLIAESVFAPVIHEGKRQGAYVVGVHRSEPCVRGAVR